MFILTTRTILVGEVGLSHEGSLGIAMSMAKACKEAQLDYVKFQFHQPDFESTVDETFRVNVFPQDLSRYDYWKRTGFNEEAWQQLIKYCNEIGIGFLCTPFSVWASQQLINFGIQDVKISSGDANNWELLEHIKKNYNRVIVSLGMSNRVEVKKLLDFMQDYNGELIVLQCTSSYPTKPDEIGMNYFKELKSITSNVGISDHSGTPFTAIAAIASEASLVEFHVVYSKLQFGPDTSSSLTFTEALQVSQFRNYWLDLFNSDYDKDKISGNLGELRRKFGRGLTLKKDLKKGEVLLAENLTLKKPQGPLRWEDRFKLIGKKTTRKIDANEHLNLSDLE